MIDISIVINSFKGVVYLRYMLFILYYYVCGCKCSIPFQECLVSTGRVLVYF